MSKEKNPVVAPSTHVGFNRFKIKLYIHVTEEGTLLPLAPKFRRRAHRVVTLELEYPSYHEELEFKRLSTRYDRQDHVHWIDTDVLQEARVRRCLCSWDLHTVIPETGAGKLHRIKGQLEDDSMEMWQHLPPLLRKAVSEMIHSYLGTP